MKTRKIIVSTLIASSVLVTYASAQTADLGVVKTYLLHQLAAQKAGTSSLRAASNRYFELAKTANFDYAKLGSGNPDAVRKALQDARAGWRKASPVYESVEGIVAGVEMLNEFDLNLDAGSPKSVGGESVVTFDLKLPNGKTIEKPGNLFGVNEGALWGSEKSFSSTVKFDVDKDGRIGFGDQLPDANILKAASDTIDEMTAKLIETGQRWQPTAKDIVGALTANVPTAASVFIERWKTSRFVLGDKSTQRDFNVISSLNDLEQNVGSWQNLYKGLSGAVKTKNADLNAQINDGLSSLKAWAAKLQAQEQIKRFTPEQAEIIAKEGQNRATAIIGKITQAAALIGVKASN